jgi:hypothetical protein
MKMKIIHPKIKLNGHITVDEIEALREEIAQETHELESELIEREEELSEYSKEAGAWEDEEDESVSY